MLSNQNVEKYYLENTIKLQIFDHNYFEANYRASPLFFKASNTIFF